MKTLIILLLKVKKCWNSTLLGFDYSLTCTGIIRDVIFCSFKGTIITGLVGWLKLNCTSTEFNVFKASSKYLRLKPISKSSPVICTLNFSVAEPKSLAFVLNCNFSIVGRP